MNNTGTRFGFLGKFLAIGTIISFAVLLGLIMTKEDGQRPYSLQPHCSDFGKFYGTIETIVDGISEKSEFTVGVSLSQSGYGVGIEIVWPNNGYDDWDSLVNGYDDWDALVFNEPKALEIEYDNLNDALCAILNDMPDKIEDLSFEEIPQKNNSLVNEFYTRLNSFADEITDGYGVYSFTIGRFSFTGASGEAQYFADLYLEDGEYYEANSPNSLETALEYLSRQLEEDFPDLWNFEVTPQPQEETHE